MIPSQTVVQIDTATLMIYFLPSNTWTASEHGGYDVKVRCQSPLALSYILPTQLRISIGNF